MKKLGPRNSSCVIIPKSKEYARKWSKFISFRMQSLVEIWNTHKNIKPGTWFSVREVVVVIGNVKIEKACNAT